MTDVIAEALGYVYAKRHKVCEEVMSRIQNYILTSRKAEDEKRKM